MRTQAGRGLRPAANRETPGGRVGEARGGAQGVGQATTNAVVSASILILLFNYILTGIFFAADV